MSDSSRPGCVFGLSTNRHTFLRSVPCEGRHFCFRAEWKLSLPRPETRNIPTVLSSSSAKCPPQLLQSIDGVQRCPLYWVTVSCDRRMTKNRLSSEVARARLKSEEKRVGWTPLKPNWSAGKFKSTWNVRFEGETKVLSLWHFVSPRSAHSRHNPTISGLLVLKWSTSSRICVEPSSVRSLEKCQVLSHSLSLDFANEWIEACRDL